MNIPCILIPLLVGLISAVLGYLLGKMNSKSDSSCNNCDQYRIDLEACRKRNAQLEVDLSASKTSASAPLAVVAKKQSIVTELPKKVKTASFDAALALTAFGKKVKQDDLKIIEGIGPKIEGLFHDAGIKTWQKLSETTVAQCQKILDAAGDRYSIHKPGTWPKQSKMAAEGKWAKLKTWQDSLKGGKE